jgi:hypothetical protein
MTLPNPNRMKFSSKKWKNKNWVLFLMWLAIFTSCQPHQYLSNCFPMNCENLTADKKKIIQHRKVQTYYPNGQLSAVYWAAYTQKGLEEGDTNLAKISKDFDYYSKNNKGYYGRYTHYHPNGKVAKKGNLYELNYPKKYKEWWTRYDSTTGKKIHAFRTTKKMILQIVDTDTCKQQLSSQGVLNDSKKTTLACMLKNKRTKEWYWHSNPKGFEQTTRTPTRTIKKGRDAHTKKKYIKVWQYTNNVKLPCLMNKDKMCEEYDLFLRQHCEKHIHPYDEDKIMQKNVLLYLWIKQYDKSEKRYKSQYVIDKRTFHK